MCGRFAVAQTRFERIEQILATEFPEPMLRYNIAPTQTIAAIRQSEHGDYVMEDCRWGLLVPPFPWQHRILSQGVALDIKPVVRNSEAQRALLIPVK